MLTVSIHTRTTLLGIYYAYYAGILLLSPIEGLICCVLRDALLHSIAVMHSYLRYCHLLHPQNFRSLAVFCFSQHPLESVLYENPRRSAVSEIFKPPCLTIPWSKSLRHFLPYFDVWSEQQLNLLTMSASFSALICCHIIGWLYMGINKLVCRCT